MTTKQRESIPTPLQGAIIYNTDLECLQVNNSTGSTPSWECIEGLVGPQGPQGEPGPIGETGKGASGPRGQQGEAGLSAFQIWLSLGNVGTEADFIASLQGSGGTGTCLLYTSPSPRDATLSRMPSSA